MTGMRRFTLGEMARMRAVQVGAMQDTGRVWRWSETAGTFGEERPAYTPGPVVECGMQVNFARNQRREEFTDVRIDAQCRLPLGTEIGPHDRWEWISRYGTELTPHQFYEVDGAPKPGPTGIVIDLKITRAWENGLG